MFRKKKRLVYLSTPYRADSKEIFEEQLKYTKQIAKKLLLGGFDVIVPHLTYTQFLNDEVEAEREQGIRAALRLISYCDAIFVSTKKEISQGMRAEIEEAQQIGTPIYYFKELDLSQAQSKKDILYL